MPLRPSGEQQWYHYHWKIWSMDKNEISLRYHEVLLSGYRVEGNFHKWNINSPKTYPQKLIVYHAHPNLPNLCQVTTIK
jgi:hypothetical protein